MRSATLDSRAGKEKTAAFRHPAERSVKEAAPAKVGLAALWLPLSAQLTWSRSPPHAGLASTVCGRSIPAQLANPLRARATLSLVPRLARLPARLWYSEQGVEQRESSLQTGCQLSLCVNAAWQSSDPTL